MSTKNHVNIISVSLFTTQRAIISLALHSHKHSLLIFKFHLYKTRESEEKNNAKTRKNLDASYIAQQKPDLIEKKEL